MITQNNVIEIIIQILKFLLENERNLFLTNLNKLYTN